MYKNLLDRFSSRIFSGGISHNYFKNTQTKLRCTCIKKMTAKMITRNRERWLWLFKKDRNLVTHSLNTHEIDVESIKFPCSWLSILRLEWMSEVEVTGWTPELFVSCKLSEDPPAFCSLSIFPLLVCTSGVVVALSACKKVNYVNLHY